MKIKKVLAGMAVAAVATVGLVGCSSEVGTTPNSNGVKVSSGGGVGSVSIIELPEGDRNVKCAVLIGYNKGGISCDWANAKEVAR